MFPIIKHINDVMPAIEGRPEFTARHRDGYIAVDYNYTVSDSFDCPIRRECRGVKFDLDGNLIARPLHKFFNLHEKPDEVPDLSSGVIMEKLDGSMCHATVVNNEVVFMTRAGITDQAKMAFDFANGSPVISWCRDILEMGMTPIFEFTSPHNQIVIKYDKPALTLLAIRKNKTGEYIPQYVVAAAAKKFAKVPSVQVFSHSAQDLDAFVAHTKGLENMEGYVVRVGQQFVKLKADAYVSAHRAKSGLLFEKDVLRLVLENKIDDVLGMLTADEGKALQEWADDVNSRVRVVADFLNGVVEPNGQMLRADFARLVKDRFGDVEFLPSMLFSVFNGRDANEVVRSFGLKCTTNTQKAKAFRVFLTVAEWKPFMFAKLVEC